MKYTIEEITNWLNKHGLMGHSLVRDLSEENILAANPSIKTEMEIAIDEMINGDFDIHKPHSVAECDKRKTEDIPQKYDPNVCPADNFEPFNDGIPL